MIDDEEAEVRRVVARRIPRDWLLRMASDRGRRRYGWRSRSVSRPDLLSRLRYDPDWRVRYEVASRIAVGEIAELAEDSDGFVQDMARSRVDRQTGAARGVSGMSNIVRDSDVVELSAPPVFQLSARR